MPIPIVSARSGSAIALALAGGRSALISGRKLRKVASPQGGPIFGAPPLWDGTTHPLTVAALQQHGEERTRHQWVTVSVVTADEYRMVVNDIEADGVIAATPAHHASRLFDGDLRTALGSFDTSMSQSSPFGAVANEQPEHLLNRPLPHP